MTVRAQSTGKELEAERQQTGRSEEEALKGIQQEGESEGTRGGRQRALFDGAEGPREQGRVNAHPWLDRQPGGQEKPRAPGRDFRLSTGHSR